jgi:hypothetical protein
MPSTAVMCCCSSVNGTGVAGRAGAGGVEGPATVGEGAPLLDAVVAFAVDTTEVGGGVWDCDNGDGPGKARPEGPGRVKELGPGRASPFAACDACWG